MCLEGGNFQLHPRPLDLWRGKMVWRLSSYTSGQWFNQSSLCSEASIKPASLIRILHWQFFTTSTTWEAHRRPHTYLICLITDGFDVGFSPSSWYPVDYFTIVHIIARNFSPSSLIWLLPSKNHWITKTFETGDVTGWRWWCCCNMKSLWVDRTASVILRPSNCFIDAMREGTRSWV